MATNRRKVMVPHTMGAEGVDLLMARDDIETISYPATIRQVELLPMLSDIAAIALAGTPYRQTEIEASPAMQVVARIGVGYDAVDLAALTACRVPLMVAGTANSTSVAEQAFRLMIALAKRHEALDKLVREARWGDRRAGLPTEISGKTVVIVGFGRIGTRLARRCLAFDMQVLIYDPYVDPATIRGAGCEPVADLDAALTRADFVSIHCPKNAEPVGMFNASRLAKMKQSAYLVNTARGGIIDERALHRALTTGRIAAAGLDAFEAEPTPRDNPLLKLENVVASPHMAGVTAEAVAAMAVQTAKNVLSVLDGAPLRENVITKEVL